MKDADGNYRLLTTAERAEERRELAFQRQVNGNHYVTWNRLLRRVDPERRYRVLRFGTAEAMQEKSSWPGPTRPRASRTAPW